MKIVLSCEHASAALPEGYQDMFEGREQAILWSHRGWDPGALRLAHMLEEVLEAPLVQGQWTRLLLDLNRSAGNPDRWSDYSRSLSEAKRDELEALIFKPYWNSLYREIENAIKRAGRVLHLSIHSFVRVFNNRERDVDVGVLFDPVRCGEKLFSNHLCSQLQARGGDRFRIFQNVPYAGTEDGLTGILRTHFSDEQYLGIEIELCSDLLEEKKSIGEVGACLAEAVCQTINDLKLS